MAARVRADCERDADRHRLRPGRTHASGRGRDGTRRITLFRREAGEYTPSLSARLDDLPEKVERAVERLRAGPASWIHVDAHLDNVLWRLDGTAVLVDWVGAAIGPPSIDLARCVTEGLDSGSNPDRTAALLSAYAQELRSSEVGDVSMTDLRTSLAHALLPLLQSAVGWAGRPEDREPEGRVAALRESLLRSACAWIASYDDAF